LKRKIYFMHRLNYLIFSYYQNLHLKVNSTTKPKFFLKKIKSLQLTNVFLLSIVIFYVSFITMFAPVITQASFSLFDTQMIRIHVIENGFSHEWEFDHPDQFEYELGDKIVKGEYGKQMVEEMIDLLQLQETSQIDDMVAILKKRYPGLEHLDIRMRNAEGELYTWVWNKNSAIYQ